MRSEIIREGGYYEGVHMRGSIGRCGTTFGTSGGARAEPRWSTDEPRGPTNPPTEPRGHAWRRGSEERGG